MSWADIAAGCRDADGQPAIIIGMAAYDAGAPIFDPSIDQRLLPGWIVCGQGQRSCPLVDGRFRLAITVPTTDIACNLQVGAGIGLPLAVVGPSGSYYTAAIRGDQGPNLLVGAINFATTPCPATAAETTTPPTSTAPAPETTAPPATVAPPVSVAPATAAAPAAAQPTTAPVPTAAATPTGAEAAAAQRQLARTGGHGSELALLGALLVIGGAAAVTVQRRTRTR